MSQANNVYSRISQIQEASVNNIWTDGTNEWVTVYFKEAFTTNIKYYNIRINWTITQFLGIVKEWLIQDFDLDDRNYTNYSIEIIEMSQEIPGVKSENAPKLEDLQTKYYDKYINNNKWPGFYFKIITTNA
jgi:hypothetical protein